MLLSTMSALTNIERFNQACSRHARRGLIVAGITIATVFACFAGVLPFKHGIRAFYAQHFGRPAAEILMGLTPFPALLVMFAGFWLIHCKAKTIPELFCRHCNKSVVSMRHLVVSTRNCPHCGQRILAEPENSET